jgi:hypothetical protein
VYTDLETVTLYRTIIGIMSNGPHHGKNDAHPDLKSVTGEYLTTPEATEYLRKSVSWLLRQPHIPYLKGKPNIDRRKDLDRWFEQSILRPRVKL